MSLAEVLKRNFRKVFLMECPLRNVTLTRFTCCKLQSSCSKISSNRFRHLVLNALNRLIWSYTFFYVIFAFNFKKKSLFSCVSFGICFCVCTYLLQFSLRFFCCSHSLTVCSMLCSIASVNCFSFSNSNQFLSRQLLWIVFYCKYFLLKLRKTVKV